MEISWSQKQTLHKLAGVSWDNFLSSLGYKQEPDQLLLQLFVKCSLDADGEALCLGRPFPDQVRPAAVGFQEVVRLLALHVPRKPKGEEWHALIIIIIIFFARIKFPEFSLSFYEHKILLYIILQRSESNNGTWKTRE